MDFEWDDHNEEHIAAHDISRDEAEQVLLNDPLELELQNEGGEQSLMEMGETNSGRILVVVSTWRNEDVRVVTAYVAPTAMRVMYEDWRRRIYGAGL